MACGRTARIDAVISDAPSSDIVVKMLNVNTFDVLDTVALDEAGKLSYKVQLDKGQIEFVYLYYGGKRIVSLLLKGGDKVTVVADTLGCYTVDGSEESAKLAQVEQDYAAALKKMTRMSYDIENAADAGIGNTALHRFRHTGLHLKIGPCAKNTKQQERTGDNKHQHHAVSGGTVGSLLISFAQALAQQRIDTHADTDGKANLEVLHRKGKGQGRNGAFGNLGNINAVHHVVKGLDQHGNDHGNGHIGKQLANGHNAHLVLL